MTATAVIQPIDMVKVRIQLKSEARASSLSPFKIARDIYKNEGGVKGFYRGIDSALLRQAVYCTLRLGLYFNLSDYIRKNVNSGANLSPLQKAYSSLITGAIGSFVGNPFDVVLVRMQADKTLPVAERRNYPNVFVALYRVAKAEGIKAYLNGVIPTMLRATFMNIAQLMTYEEVKERLEGHYGKKHKNAIIFASSMISAVNTAIASLPPDNLKTKL